jgi:methionine biosynthesis protein MetW
MSGPTPPSRNRWFHRNYDIILSLVERNSSVLDVGCGDGTLLRDLVRDRDVRALGIELSEEAVVRCTATGIPVIQADIDLGLKEFRSGSWDTVILNRTLQVLRRPEFVLDEMLRVGRRAVVGLPNFGYYKTRLDLLLKGRMPVSKSLPYPWYESPNIHLCTIRDFEDLVKKKGYRILDEFYIQDNRADGLIGTFPNLLATEAVFLLGRGKRSV